jgi:beta-lactamase superfamily II metal-dependent hydrolase
MERYRVERLMATFIEDDNATYKALLKLADEQRVQRLKGKAGVRIRIGDVAYMDVLYPFEDLSGTSVSNTNSTSIVAKLTAPLHTFLFTGDLEAAQEYELLARHMSVAADVLKLGHHGSKTSSTAQFLSAVQPSVAVVSAGADNRYGHPHQEVLDRAGAIAGSVLRTYGGGDVVIAAE